jgi:hypothetical protein
VQKEKEKEEKEKITIRVNPFGYDGAPLDLRWGAIFYCQRFGF